MKIMTKLIVSFLGVAAICLAIGILALTVSNSYGKLSNKATDVTELRHSFQQAEFDHLKWSYELAEVLWNSEDELTIQTDFHQCRMGKFIYGEGMEKLRKADTETLSMLNSIIEEHKELHVSSIEIKDMWKNRHGKSELELAELRQKIGSIIKNRTLSYSTSVLGTLKKINDRLIEVEDNLHEKQAAAQSFQTVAIWIGMILGTLAAIVMGYMIAKSIAKPINNMVVALKNIAQGDFTQNIEHHSKDEIGTMGETMMHMSENLSGTLSEVRDVSQQVWIGAKGMSEASQSLSQGATEQASSLEEITSSITEMRSQTQTNAGNASNANQLSTTAHSAAQEGNKQMNSMITAMNDIQGSSKEISKIIKVIDDIAFQTNLLALNAAVEAARAGKHGKGFAVVAEEVRNLAARSGKAARETGELIEGSVRKVENGMEIVGKTANSLDEIVNSVTQVTNLVSEIATASNEQAQAIAQISQGLDQIDIVTQKNTSNAEETATSAEKLSSQSMKFKAILGKFKLRGGNNNTNNDFYSNSYNSDYYRNNVSRITGNDHEDQEVREREPISIAMDDKEFGRY